MIKIDFKRLIRSRQWFGFTYFVCEISDVQEWGWFPADGSLSNNLPGMTVFKIISFLNKYV